jgi:uroporphyrinogen III methyltransferase/synthase
MSPTQGKVYLVGAGPGDPGLITVRGLDLIRKADVVVYDRLVNRRLLSNAPVQAEQVFAGKSPEGAAMDQGTINDLLVREAREGKTVVRLKGGDPFVFGRGGEEAQALARHGIEFEVVPGITSAVPAYAGIPVTHRDVSSSFTVITGHEDPNKELSNLDWGKLAGAAGTLIILMGISRLEGTVQKLIEHGLAKDTPAVSTEWGTEYQQRTVEGDLSDIVERARTAGLGAPAVTVVGEVVRLRESLRWFDKKPLFGKRVLVTRARAQAGALSELLEEAGSVVSEVPSIEIQDPEDWGPMDKAIAGLADYSWVIFTSVNAVDSFFHRLGLASMDARSMAGIRVCAIGPATASALLGNGIHADYVPAVYTAEKVAEGLGSGGLAGSRVLLPRADIAPAELVQAIEEQGATVEQVVAYQTVTPRLSGHEAREALVGGRVDVVTFTSSSTVRNFHALLGDDATDLLNKVTTACIGPVTARTAEGLGIQVGILAAEHTIRGLVAAIVDEMAPNVDEMAPDREA